MSKARDLSELPQGDGDVTVDGDLITNGNVGIGTASPSGRLHTSETNGINYFESPGISSIGLQFRTNGTNRYRIGTPSGSADLHFLAGGVTEVVRIAANGQQSSVIPGGSTLFPEFKCRAWVNFNGTTSPGTIRASGNVSSVTKNSVGNYTVNMTNAMPNVNYSYVGTCTKVAGNVGSTIVAQFDHTVARTTSAFRFETRNTGGGPEDSAHINISVFR